MKKIRLSMLMAILIVILAASIALGKSNSLVVNPLGLLFGVVNGQYEQKVSDKSTLVVSGMYLGGTVDNWDLRILGGAVGMRQYFGEEVLKGPYLGANVIIGFANADYIGYNYYYEDGTATVIGIGGEAGFKWVMSNGFTFELGAGLATPVMTNVTSGDVSETTVGSAVGGSLSFGIGYTW